MKKGRSMTDLFNINLISVHCAKPNGRQSRVTSQQIQNRCNVEVNVTAAKFGGYYTRQAIAEAKRANRIIQDCLSQLIETPGPQRSAVLIAKANNALAGSWSALDEISQISAGKEQAE